MQYIASALLRRTPACISSFSVPLIQSSPPGTAAMNPSTRSMPVPPVLRRVVRAAVTIACDCSPSRRSASGSSWLVKNSSKPVHSSRLSVAPTRMKKIRFTIIDSSYLDVRDLANDQNPDDLRTNRISEEFAARGIGPQKTDVLGLENPES